MKSWCLTEQKAFFDAVVAFEMSDGATVKEANAIAKEEMDLAIEDAVDGYSEHLAAGTLPVKEG